MEAPDIALLVVYAYVVIYFLRRFVRFGKLPSLGIAVLPAGWVLLALAREISMSTMLAMKWVGVFFGVMLVASVWHTDRVEKPEPKKR